MNIYSSLQELQQYRQSPFLNQSFLKQILQNNTKPFKDTIQATLGSCLDTILTTKGLEKDLYHIGLAKRPSDAVKEIIDSVWNVIRSVDSADCIAEFNEYKDLFLKQAREVNYQANYGDDALWNALKKDGQSYWEELYDAGDKKIITQDEWNLSTDLAARTLMSPITGMYFTEEKEIDKYFQIPLYWTMIVNGQLVECKGLGDEIVVSHPTKKIVYLDLKGTDMLSIDSWFQQVCTKKFYPFQMAWYKEGILEHPTFKPLIEQGYTLEFRWMVIPFNTYRFKPWIIPVTEQLIHAGKYGYSKQGSYKVGKTLIDSGYDRAGWLEALTIYQESVGLGLLDYDTEWFKSQGRMTTERVNELFFN